MKPIDTSTGRQCGSEPLMGDERVPVLVGWLVTHEGGFEARLGPDRGRADAYLRQHRGARVEALFVMRKP